MEKANNHINITLNVGSVTRKYIQTIKSELNFKDKLETSNSSKTILLKVDLEEQGFGKATIETKKNDVSLGKSFSHQKDLTLKMATLTNNIRLGLDIYGEIKTIDNYDHIVNKWRNLKRELESYYKGSVSEVYFEGIEKKIINHEKLVADMKQNRLFGLFFKGVYNSGVNFEDKTISVDNWVNHIPIYIDESINVDLINKEENQLKLIVKGKLNKEKTFIRKIENHFKRNGGNTDDTFELKTYNGEFEYNLATGLIEDVSFVIETKFGSVYNRKDLFEIKAIEA